MTLTRDDSASARVIADAIGSDPILAARILRAANSPLYALGRPVTALPLAVNTLGNDAIYRLVVVFATSDSFRGKRGTSPHERRLWEHSVTVALAARELMLALGMRGVEEAFLCGLLHDIGKLLLLRYDQKLFAPTLEIEDEQQLLECERATYGYTHAQVGGLVARRWGLPEEVYYTILNHHQPGEAGQSMVMARVVDVADGMANGSGRGVRPAAARDLALTESAIALDLTEEKIQAVWAKTEAGLGEVLGLFR
jgi:putative nucleotidyltransferase with HDIG domain